MVHHPEFAVAAVRRLYIGMAVRNGYAAQILGTCKGVSDLTLCVICHHLLTTNPVIEPLEVLPLTSLSVDLSSISHDRLSYLPNLMVAHRITRLHLTNAWASWPGMPVGLTRLHHLTHLSVPWCTSSSNCDLAREVLQFTNLKVLILWRGGYKKRDELVKCLSRGRLEDCRIVCLDSKSYSHYLIYGGFWDYAENLIKWCEEVNGMSFSPLQVLHHAE